MNKIFLRFLVIFSSIFFLGNGCSQRTYYQLIAYDSPTPLLYEVKRDTTTVSKFVGTDYMDYKGYHDEEKINILRLSYQISNTKKFSVTNLNFQVIAGNYKVSGIDGKYTQDSIYDGNKIGFGGRVGISGGINFNINGFRLGIGIEPSVNFDFGNFYSFRRDAGNKGLIINEADFLILNFNLFPYLSVPIGNKSMINLQMNIGFPGFLSPILSYQIKDNIFWMDFFPPRINVGVMMSYDLIKGIF